MAGSEDFVLYDADNWTEDEREHALETRSQVIELGLLGERKRNEGVEKEYPDVPSIAQQRPMTVSVKGRNRNEPCPCGSGKKSEEMSWPYVTFNLLRSTFVRIPDN